MDAKAGARERLERRARAPDRAQPSHPRAIPSSASRRSAPPAGSATRSTPPASPSTRGVCDLPTAFVARAGSGPLHVAICAEYDALPGIGHACGHNMIAAMAVGAAHRRRRASPTTSGSPCSVIGTPAEEGGGGKILLLERGVFAGVHAAMMVHPAPIDVVEPPFLACAQFEVHYTGKAAHASAFPERGINAADALTVAQTAIGCCASTSARPIASTASSPTAAMRRTSCRRTPPRRYIVRARTLERARRASAARSMRCFEAGALATGATLAHRRDDHRRYAEVRPRRRDRRALPRATPRRSAAASPTSAARSSASAGSTDMGNVSLAMPSIHPMIGIELAAGGEPPARVHRPLRDAGRRSRR